MRLQAAGCRLQVLMAAACGARTAAPVVDNHGGGASAAVELTVDASGGGHAAIVHNGGDAPVQLHRDIVVRDAGGAQVDTSGLYLRDHCEMAKDAVYEPPECVTLAAGATLRTEPWTDEIGDAQCMCEECGPVAAGEYTFTITRCDDGAPITSAPFAVSGR